MGHIPAILAPRLILAMGDAMQDAIDLQGLRDQPVAGQLIKGLIPGLALTHRLGTHCGVSRWT